MARRRGRAYRYLGRLLAYLPNLHKSFASRAFFGRLSFIYVTVPQVTRRVPAGVNG